MARLLSLPEARPSAAAEEVKKNHFIGIYVESEVHDKRIRSC